MKENRVIFELLKQKHLQIGFFQKIFSVKLRKRKKTIASKFAKIPQSTIDEFDETEYLYVNRDVQEAISEGQYENGLEHFILYGYAEVQSFKRLLKDENRSYEEMINNFDEESYLKSNPDVAEAIKNAHYKSALEHFKLFGYDEIKKGTRKLNDDTSYTYIEVVKTAEISAALKNFKTKPLISVIMPVYNVDPKWLSLAIESLKSQWYENWELCIVDDASTNKKTIDFLNSIKNPKLKIKFLKQNVNISVASNEALKLAKGSYIALMDNDDELTPDALYEVVLAINSSNAEFIYSDEDKLELDGSYSEPHFKPDFAPDMFLSQNYLSHLGVIKKSLLEEVKGWEVGLEGAQDYDLYLKILEKTDKVVHIPKVLYHWRKIPGSTAAEFSDKSYAQKAGKISLENALKRRKILGRVDDGVHPGTYRVKYDIVGKPLVSIIIPFKDKPELLDMCINSILNKSTYSNYEIIGISNNSEENETFAKMKELETKDKRVSFYEYNTAFNFSDINNHAVNKYAKGEHILLLNNDIEIISSQWIESMLEFSQQKRVGVVGAKLYYPNNTIQHAGISVGVLQLAGHNFRHALRNVPCYMGRESVIQNVSAVTAACVMVKKTIYKELKGLDEVHLKVAFNDVDFCLRVQERGYLNVFTPYCEAYHYESVSRGKEDNPEKQKRFNSEVDYMMQRHEEILKNGDPYYNKNLTLLHENFSPKVTIQKI